MKRMALTVLVVLAVAACAGGDSKPAAQSASSSPAATSSDSGADLTVRFVAQQTGSGCTGTNHGVSKGAQATIRDDVGTVIATSTFHLSPGAQVCDFETITRLPRVPAFITIDSGSGTLATVQASDIADGKVTLDGDITGRVTVRQGS